MLGAESLAGAGEQRRVYNWNDIRRDIDSETPKMEDFGGGKPYSDEEVAHDLDEIAKAKAQPGYRVGEWLSEADIQEYATAQEIGEMDWFGEDDRADALFPDGKGDQLSVHMTSEYDDHFGHIDVVCLMNNACSNFRTVPFALDLTYTEEAKHLDKKFSHDFKGIPGFCRVKYFEDNFHFEPQLPKGGIRNVPRFVVGFNPALSKTITEQRMTNTGGWGNLAREEPSNEAKFCVLRELKEQSEQMLEYLDKQLQSGPSDRLLAKRLAKMQRNVRALDQYFGGALEVARENDPNGRYEKYSNRDTVFREIISRNIMNTRAGGGYNPN